MCEKKREKETNEMKKRYIYIYIYLRLLIVGETFLCGESPLFKNVLFKRNCLHMYMAHSL